MRQELRGMGTGSSRVTRLLGGGEEGGQREVAWGKQWHHRWSNPVLSYWRYLSRGQSRVRWNTRASPSLRGPVFRAAQLADSHNSVGFQRLRAAIHCHPLSSQIFPAQSPAQPLGMSLEETSQEKGDRPLSLWTVTGRLNESPSPSPEDPGKRGL